MKLDSNAFSLRDYITYVFPGILLICAYFNLDNESWNVVKDNNIYLTTIFLIGGYFAGYISVSISNRTFVKLFKRFQKDPLENLLNKPEDHRFSEKFTESLKYKLKEYWGEEVYGSSQSTVLQLCWRDIQLSNSVGISFQFRLISLWNFCASCYLPLFIWCILFVFQEAYLLSFLTALMFFVLFLSRHDLRKNYTKNIYIIWYVLHKDIK